MGEILGVGRLVIDLGTHIYEGSQTIYAKGVVFTTHGRTDLIRLVATLSYLGFHVILSGPSK